MKHSGLAHILIIHMKLSVSASLVSEHTHTHTCTQMLAEVC